jgi:hypothetical protein
MDAPHRLRQLPRKRIKVLLVGFVIFALVTGPRAMAGGVKSFADIPFDSTVTFLGIGPFPPGGFFVDFENFLSANQISWHSWDGGGYYSQDLYGLYGAYSANTGSTIAPYSDRLWGSAMEFVFTDPVYFVGGTFVATPYPLEEINDSFAWNFQNVSYQVAAYDEAGILIQTALSSSYGNIQGPVETHLNYRGTEFMASYAGVWTNTPIKRVTFSGIRPQDGAVMAAFGSFAFSRTAPPDAEGPVASVVLATPNPVPVGTDIILTANVDDATKGGSNILEASYTVDGGTPFPMGAQDGTFDAVSENVSEVVPAFTEPGVHEICADGTDVGGNIGANECIFLVVYDPSSGFVTGGGWINSPEGAYTPNPTLIGKANFSFVSKYKKGTNIPTGLSPFEFKVADLNFYSDNYQWLVISGAKAQFKGVGTINGGGYYDFLLTAIDGQISGGGTDKFRIKIWDEATGIVTYDNKAGASDYGEDATELTGGSIVIHK